MKLEIVRIYYYLVASRALKSTLSQITLGFAIHYTYTFPSAFGWLKMQHFLQLINCEMTWNKWEPMKSIKASATLSSTTLINWSAACKACIEGEKNCEDGTIKKNKKQKRLIFIRHSSNKTQGVNSLLNSLS